VKSEALGLEGDTKYLYNSGTMDVYPITEETKINCATWYWKGSKASLYGLDDDAEKQSEFLDALEYYGITEVYYSIGASKLLTQMDMVETFVKNAYARNMKVYLLVGEKTWLYEDTYSSAIYRCFDAVETYNSLVDYGQTRSLTGSIVAKHDISRLNSRKLRRNMLNPKILGYPSVCRTGLFSMTIRMKTALHTTCTMPLRRLPMIPF
jgi:hypothetical protein